MSESYVKAENTTVMIDDEQQHQNRSIDIFEKPQLRISLSQFYFFLHLLRKSSIHSNTLIPQKT